MSPEAIVKPWHHQAEIAVKLTAEQIRSSPDIDTAMPVSRMAEELLHRHYHWTPYWDSTIVPIPPIPSPPHPLTVEEDRQEAGRSAESLVDVRLRSANELAGYHVKAATATSGTCRTCCLTTISAVSYSWSSR
jgi:hypothetical protein